MGGEVIEFSIYDEKRGEAPVERKSKSDPENRARDRINRTVPLLMVANCLYTYGGDVTSFPRVGSPG